MGDSRSRVQRLSHTTLTSIADFKVKKINKLRFFRMWRILDSVSYPVLIFIAAFMLLAPFSPMPHVVEKFIMLKNGNLTQAVDIFDLCFHLAPTVLLVIKFFRKR